MSIFGSFWKKNSEKMQKASSPGKWRVGDRIAGRFEIDRILGGEGKSGMGIVYVCFDYKHSTTYVLKTFQDKYFASEEVKRLFEREALLWIALGKHPCIVRLYWVESFEGRLFIALEYIRSNRNGKNILTHYMEALTLPDILKFSIQFCYGMEYAYSKGIDCHRDIKPDNIMITPDKTVKITDFGLAKAFQEIQLKEEVISVEQNPSLSIFQSKGKQICGTLPYMAPEQFEGYADKRSDVYAFGVTLYQMVTKGKFPFVGRTIQEWEKLHKQEKIPALNSALFPVIQKCLEKSPEKRYQEFVIIREELQEFLLREKGQRMLSPREQELETWAIFNKGVSLNSLGRYQEAIACYDKVIAMNPKDAEAWYHKGFTLYSLSRYNEAINCYDEAIKIKPRYVDSWNDKGFVLECLGRYEEALECYDRALEIKPAYVVALRNKERCIQKARR